MTAWTSAPSSIAHRDTVRASWMKYALRRPRQTSEGRGVGGTDALFASVVPAVVTVRVAVTAGQVRLIAIGAAERSATLPDVPTVRESGLPDFEATTWIGLYGPAKLPAALARRISERVAGILQQPEMRERLAGMGTEARSGTPEELRDILARDIARWGNLVREGNIRSE